MPRLALTSNYAAAHAVKMCDVDVIPVYPITPQTTIAEKLSEFIANGELEAEIIHVESEHSALSAAVGAAAAGARVFTATCSQGLMLAYELLPIAAGLRLPMVMAVPCRAVSAPISIHGDYIDLMLARDTGWVILIASSAQEVFDTIIQAFRIGEHPDVLLPVMVAYDGFLMSHTMEAVEVPDNEDAVRAFVPKRVSWITLDVDRPATLGPLALPDWYYEIRYQQVPAMRNAYKVVKEVGEVFGKTFGRRYDAVETYRIEDADYVLVGYGATWGFIQEAIDILRERGISIGGLRIRLLRPVPVDDLAELLRDKKGFVVVDKVLITGTPTGPVFSDIVNALVSRGIHVPGISVVHGVGQRTMYVRDFVELGERAVNMFKEGKVPRETIFLGLRA